MSKIEIYKDALDAEMQTWKDKINPTMGNSPKRAKERIDEFLEVLPNVEKRIDEFTTEHFAGEEHNGEGRAQIKAIAQKAYDDFVDYCQIPLVSRKKTEE